MTECFAAGWLALRAGADAAARSADLARAFTAALPPSPRLLDLGAGTGANARYLEARFVEASLGPPRWTLVDRDARLLDGAVGLRRPAARLALDFAAAPDRLDLAGCDGATASALCDLVSAAWFDAFASRAASLGLPLLFALSVDGRHDWRPADPADALVMRRFAADQSRDKGFGPALGAAAPDHMTASLVRHGYRVRRAASDWRLGPVDGALLSALADDIAAAATRAAGRGAAAEICAIADWTARRRAQAAAGALHLALGHIDILALPSREAPDSAADTAG